MKTYNFKNGLQAIKDAWFFGEDLLITPWHCDKIYVAKNQEKSIENECVLEHLYKTFPGDKIYVKNSDFSNVDEYLNYLEDNLIIMAENISSDPDKRKRRLGYLYITQLAFAIRERITLEELYATDDEIKNAEQIVEDFMQDYDATERIYCDYHKDKDITFEDHIIINFTGDLDADYHFCNEDCAKRFILAGHFK